MAISTSTLTTTVSESISLNGSTYGNTVTKTHTGVKIVRQQTVTVPTSEVTLFNLALEATTAGADVTPGTFAADSDIVNVTAIAANAAIDVELIIAATAND